MRILKHRKTLGSRLTRRHAINAEREQLPVTKGDTVRVMRGEDKGKEGKIIRVLTKTSRVVIDGVNIVKKHRKARNADEQSGIIEIRSREPRRGRAAGSTPTARRSASA
jgi:large subunit ribosomal protein L24